MKLPAGFALVDRDVAVRRGYEVELPGWLGSPEPVASDIRPTQGGRGATRSTALRGGGSAFVRRYRHGGMLRRVLRDVYWQWPARPFRELAATEAARAAGVEAPEVLAAATLPLRPPWLGLYRGVLVTRAIEGRRSLADALRASPEDRSRHAWLACASEAVARLHGAGIRHPDLNVTNVLVGDRPEDGVAIIDFDRATAKPRPVGWLGRALARRRLARSVAKLALPGLDRAAVRRALRRSEKGRLG